jgi:hypothetical protein
MLLLYEEKPKTRKKKKEKKKKEKYCVPVIARRLLDIAAAVPAQECKTKIIRY